MTTVSDGLFQFGGAPVASGGLPFLQTGNTFFVRPSTGSDGNSGKKPSQALKTLTQAHTLCTANNNDVVYMIAESNTAGSTTDYQSVSTGTLGLVWSKDATHLVGVNGGPMIGQRSRIAQTASVKTITDLVTVSANNCYIANVEIYQGVASATASYERALVVSGQRNHFVNCQISGMGDTSMDDSASRSLYITGSENLFQHCYIGLDTALRATAICEAEIVGTSGAPIARTVFEGCMFSSWTSLTTFKAFKHTYIDRFLMFKNCTFTAAQNLTSAVAPTGAIISVTPNGHVIFQASSVFGYADVSTLTDTAIYVSSFWGGAAGVVDQGVGVAATPS